LHRIYNITTVVVGISCCRNKMYNQSPLLRGIVQKIDNLNKKEFAYLTSYINDLNIKVTVQNENKRLKHIENKRSKANKNKPPKISENNKYNQMIYDIDDLIVQMEENEKYSFINKHSSNQNKRSKAKENGRLKTDGKNPADCTLDELILNNSSREEIKRDMIKDWVDVHGDCQYPRDADIDVNYLISEMSQKIDKKTKLKTNGKDPLDCTLDELILNNSSRHEIKRDMIKDWVDVHGDCQYPYDSDEDVDFLISQMTGIDDLIDEMAEFTL